MPGRSRGVASISRLELELALLRREVKRLAKVVQRHDRAFKDLIVRERHRIQGPLEDDEDEDLLEELDADLDLHEDFDRDELGENPEEDV